MTVSDYRHLRQQIIKESESNPHLLNQLKKQYEAQINSPRRFEEIDSITKLLNILEKRDVLSEDNVDPLEVIAQKLPNHDELLQKISDYKTRHVAREYVNFYSAENSLNTTMREPPQSIFNFHPFGTRVSERKLESIRDIIVKQIGNHWRDLGRNLSGQIRECDLDKIDFEHHRLETKAEELMSLYFSKGVVDPERWFLILCNALEKSRRKDLNRLIQEAMTRNI